MLQIDDDVFTVKYHLDLPVSVFSLALQGALLHDWQSTQLKASIQGSLELVL